MEEDGKVRTEHQKYVAAVPGVKHGELVGLTKVVDYAKTTVDNYVVAAAISSRGDIQIQVQQNIVDGRGRPTRIDTGAYEWHQAKDGVLINRETGFSARIEHESPAAAFEAQNIGEKIKGYMNGGEIQPTEARELLNFIRSNGRDLPD